MRSSRARSRRWAISGQLDAAQLKRLAQADVSIGDLPAGLVGLTSGTNVTIDAHAAGYGWFVDPAPLDDAEFVVGGKELVARGGSRAGTRMDLLTVVMHELGHVVGYDEDRPGVGSVMVAVLVPGVRRLPLRFDEPSVRALPVIAVPTPVLHELGQTVASARQPGISPVHTLPVRPLRVGPIGLLHLTALRARASSPITVPIAVKTRNQGFRQAQPGGPSRKSRH